METGEVSRPGRDILPDILAPPLSGLKPPTWGWCRFDQAHHLHHSLTSEKLGTPCTCGCLLVQDAAQVLVMWLYWWEGPLDKVGLK